MILVTGGTGVMGSVLVRRLCENGCKVRVFTLPDDPFEERVSGYVSDIRYGDISKGTDLRGICEDVKTVFHLAAIIIAQDEALYDKVNRKGTKLLVEEARRAGVQHFVYVSSASVTYPVHTPYAGSKFRSEQEVRKSGVPFTIVRPTLVYDKSQGGQEFDIFLDYLKKYPFVPFVGRGRALKSPVFVDDIINGLAALHAHSAEGKTYNFSGGEAISMHDFARLCLQLLGNPRKPIIPLPVWLCRLAAALLERGMRRPAVKWTNIAGVIQDANLDPEEAMQDIGYSPVKVTEKLPSCFPRGA